MKLNPRWSAIILAALLPVLAHADLPGKHPFYLHALSDLRAARWMIEHRPGDAKVSGDEDVALTEIHAALEEMKRAAIATQVGVSETAFVSRSDQAAFKLDFFTPNLRIADCGHATVAAFSYLAAEGRIATPSSSKEIVNKVLAVQLDGELVYMSQDRPIHQPVPEPHEAILASLGLRKDEVPDAWAPEIVSTGNRFLIVPLASFEQLKAIQPDFDCIRQISAAEDLIGYYLFAPVAGVGGMRIETRMFAPAYDIPEESATGTAAGGLACYLQRHMGMPGPDFAIQQGRCMATPSPSLLLVELQVEDEVVTGVRVGGSGRLMARLSLDVPG